MRIRYALTLPLLHLVVAIPPMVYQQSQGWRYISVEQATENFDREHPEPPSETMLWSPCYEYRLPSAGRLILAVDFPVALLIGTSADECGQSAIRPILNRWKYHMPVKSRVILVDCLIVLGVFTQWWLVGAWLDQRYKQLKPTRRWIIPIAIITLGGIVMAPIAFGQRGVVEHVNILSGMVAVLAWIVLLCMFIVVGLARLVRRVLNRTPQTLSSRP